MNLFKKATATVALVTLVSGVFSTGVSAYSTAEANAAANLAAKNIINAKSDVADYNLDSLVMRQEIGKVAVGVAGLTPTTTCMDKFGDVSATTPNTWACGYVEALLNNNMISANANFRPEDNISKSEAVKLMLEAAGHTGIYTNVSNWQEEVVAYASQNGVVASFSDYGTPATRGFVFNVANNAMETEEDVLDLNDLLGLGDDEDDTTTDSTEDTTDVVVSGDDMLEVTLSASTPRGATVPQGISGLPVAKFDFTAGSEDVTVTSLTVKRTGLSDKDTLGDLAAFTAEGRASKGKGDTQNNDTEAQLTLSNGGVVVKAGETKTITVVADVKTGTTADEFAIELINVTASSDVVLDDVVANTMRVGGVVAATLTVETDTTPSDVKAGEEGVAVAKFKLKGANDEDVIVKSITLKENGTVDEEDELANFELVYNNEVVATAAMTNGKYVTFDLGEGVTVREDQTEKFVVRADIIAGSAKNIQFSFDKNLDITAEGAQYGYGASISGEGVSFGTVNIEAGELTLVDMDAATDKIRADKQNVELGSIKVTNVSGNTLELQKFGVKVAIAGASAPANSFATIFENFEVVANGTSYELETTNTSVGASFSGVFQDTDLEISLPQGVTELVIRADTKENVTANTTVTLSLGASINATTKVDSDTTDGQFYVVETEDDVVVEDLTPSSLTFKKLTVIDAGATVARVPVANTAVVRGAKDVVAMIFEIDADEASAITADEIKAYVSTASGAATNQEVAQVSLYKGSVSDSNLLDRVSGSSLSSGVATFEGFNVEVAADTKTTFVVTVDVVDGSDAVTNSPIVVALESIAAEDDDNDDIVVKNGASVLSATNRLLSQAALSITDSGKLTIAADAGNSDNSDSKTILGGESDVVFSADVIATNEAIDVEKITFLVDKDLTKAVTSATLYLDDKEIATNSNSDISFVGSTGSIVFDDLTSFIVPEENVELRLELNTATIGYQKVGAVVTGVKVVDVIVSETDAEGVDSGKVLQTGDVTSAGVTAITASAKTFDISPAILTVSVLETLSSGTAKVKFTLATGGNTQTGSNTAPTVNLVGATITDLGNGNTYTIYNEDNVASTGATIAAINPADRLISDSETFVIVPQTTADGTTYTAKIGKSAITFDVNGVTGANGINVNMSSELDLGTKTY